MSYEDFFKLEITLEKLSSIAVAVHVWSLPNVQKAVQDYFQQKGRNWQKVIDNVIAQVSLLTFPDVLLCNIKNAIPLIGERIHNWTELITKGYGFHVNYAQKIFWTTDGRIDELKIVQEYWLKDKDLSALSCTSYLNKPLFNIAAMYAQEDFISDNMDQMKKEINKHLPVKMRKKKWTVYGLLSFWLIFTIGRTKSDALNKLKDCKQTGTNNLSAKELFKKCLDCDYRFAIKYLWDKLDVNEKQEIITDAADDFLEDCSQAVINNMHKYRYEIELEILVFFINKMSVIESMDYVSKNIVAIFEFFLKVWPYQELCINLIDKNLDHNPDDLRKLLKLIMKYLSFSNSNDVLLPFKNVYVYRLIFEKLLKKTSKDVKEKYFVNKTPSRFYDLYKDFDVVSFSLILNDTDLKEHREKIKANCEDILKSHALKGNYKDLNKFLDHSFSEEEKELFKQKCNFLNPFLTAGKFQCAEEHIKWLFDSESERSVAKEKIDCEEICLNLVKKHKFNLADEFLIWLFDTEEKRRSVKQALNKSDEFLCDQIYIIWCAGYLDDRPEIAVEERCSKMLKWFLESDESVIEFKKTSLIKNELFLVKYWENLFYDASFSGVDRFLEFCFRSPEEIQELKRNIKNNITWWIDIYALKEITMVDALLDWLCEGTQSKIEIKSKYLNSPKGALLCVNFFKKNFKFREPVVHFFNSWISPSTNINISEMKLHMESFDEIIVGNSVKSLILTFMARRKKDKIINMSDLKKDLDCFHEYTDMSDNSEGEHSDFNFDELSIGFSNANSDREDSGDRFNFSISFGSSSSYYDSPYDSDSS